MFDSDELLALGDVFSHEFKTPLAVIRSYINNIERRFEEGTIESMDMRKTAGAIRHCCNNLSKLSENITLASSKKKIHANRFYYDVAEQINTICFMTNELFSDGNVKATFESKTDPLIFNADADLIMSIILNLISNGIKYNISELKQIDITAEIKNERLCISVKDNGIGFPKEEAENIFERYYRTDNSAVMMASGLGLGLFLVKKMVEAHDGTIVAKPTKKGTTFKIEIPPLKELVFRSPSMVYVREELVERELSGELLKFE